VEVDVQLFLTSALLKGVCVPETLQTNVPLLEELLLLSVTILMANAHTGFSILSDLIFGLSQTFLAATMNIHFRIHLSVC
jgi:hypothetical protein